VRRPLVPAATIIATVIVSASLAGGGAASTEAPSPRLRDAVVGWSVAVPPGWRVGGRVVSTAFAVGARCRSVFAIDDLGDEGVGPGPGASRSFVQVCARALSDGRTLSGYLAATYGNSFASQYEATRLGGHTAYRARRSSPRLVWLQTDRHRIQLASAVTGDPAHRGGRRAEVDRILHSFRLAGTG
jgi:hypothetical protein